MPQTEQYEVPQEPNFTLFLRTPIPGGIVEVRSTITLDSNGIKQLIDHLQIVLQMGDSVEEQKIVLPPPNPNLNSTWS